MKTLLSIAMSVVVAIGAGSLGTAAIQNQQTIYKCDVCGTSGCIQSSSHTHNSCGVSGCSNTGNHSHDTQNGSHKSEHGETHH